MPPIHNLLAWICARPGNLRTWPAEKMVLGFRGVSYEKFFIGTAGVYHVMCELSRRGFRAAATHGNAPNFDILVCGSDGNRSAMIQVKSTTSAKRGRKGERLDFPLGYKAAKMRRSDVYVAFVDFQGSLELKPDVYLVPSEELFSWCQGWIDQRVYSVIRLQIDAVQMEPFKNGRGWERLKAAGIVSSPAEEEETEGTSSLSEQRQPPTAV